MICDRYWHILKSISNLTWIKNVQCIRGWCWLSTFWSHNVLFCRLPSLLVLNQFPHGLLGSLRCCFHWFAPLPTNIFLQQFILRRRCTTPTAIWRFHGPQICCSGLSEMVSQASPPLLFWDVPSNLDALEIVCLQVYHLYVWWRAAKGHFSSMFF